MVHKIKKNGAVFVKLLGKPRGVNKIANMLEYYSEYSKITKQSATYPLERGEKVIEMTVKIKG